MRSAQASPWFTDAVLAFYRRAMFTIGALTMSLMVVIVMAEVVADMVSASRSSGPRNCAAYS